MGSAGGVSGMGRFRTRPPDAIVKAIINHNNKTMNHSSITSLRQRVARIALLLAFACLAGCGMPITDGATRLASDINAGAGKLPATKNARLEIKHKPVSIPDGVKGPYMVEMQISSPNRPRTSGTLFITDLKSRDGWGTTYHLNYVRVPRELSVTKNAGESVTIVLERAADGKIDVTGLR
jgi:hypothetical protein